jgi:hypothetical protein
LDEHIVLRVIATKYGASNVFFWLGLLLGGMSDASKLLGVAGMVVMVCYVGRDAFRRDRW